MVDQWLPGLLFNVRFGHEARPHQRPQYGSPISLSTEFDAHKFDRRIVVQHFLHCVRNPICSVPIGQKRWITLVATGEIETLIGGAKFRTISLRIEDFDHC
jgi:hypothetical protein